MSAQKIAKKMTLVCLASAIPQLAELDCKASDNTDQPSIPTGCPVRRIGLDAAKAVRRIGQLNLILASAESLTILLDFPNIRVTNFSFENEDFLHLFCKHEYEIAICPCCGQTSSGFHEGKDRSVRHLDIWGKPTIIHFQRRRFSCQNCKKPFTERLSWIDPKRRQTKAFEQHVYECLTEQKMSRRAVALAFGLHEETVLRILRKKAKEALRHREKHFIRVLGVDEIYLGRKNYVLVLSDIERRCIITILSDRKKATLEGYLKGLSRKERRSIKVVSMDMWRPYYFAACKKLPRATIVVDRFHVMKQLNRQLDLLRRKLRRDEDKNPEVSELLKNSRWILLKNRENLTEQEEAKLKVILAASPILRRMYLMKKEFRLICNRIKDRKQAERFLRYWLFRASYSDCRYLKKFAKTLRNWYQEFLNYFIEGITQGVVEGLNRAIRGIINRAFGFRKFKNFRLQVLAEYSSEP